MTNRLDFLLQKLPQGIDAALITHPANRKYFTGFASSAGTIVATRDGCYFIIDSRYHEMAKSAIESCEVLLQGNLYEQINSLLQKHGAKTLAVESVTTSLSMAAQHQKEIRAELLCDDALSEAISALRCIKSAEEIAAIQAAQDITDHTFSRMLGVLKPGMSEIEIALEMEFYSRKNGSEAAAFGFIVAGGPNSSKPHAVPSDYVLQKGDFLTMDFGCTVNGYRSDMTRTILFGQPTEKQNRVYRTVLQAQIAAMAAIRAGVRGCDVDKVARDRIDATEFKGLFGHGLGHSLGLDIHENPRFAQHYTGVIESGTVMSVEPGIYIPGEFGVRIEDIVEITEDGFRNFTNSPKGLITL